MIIPLIAKTYNWRFILFVLAATIPTFCNGNIDKDSGKYSRKTDWNLYLNKATHCIEDFCNENEYENYLLHDVKTPRWKGILGQYMQSVWVHAIGSTLIISAAPFLLLYIIPLDNTEAMKPRLKVILAFASGGLLGDAFLHLIPHATHSHEHHAQSHKESDDSNHHHNMSIGLGVLGGIITFLAVEKLVRLIKCHTTLKKNSAKAIIKSNKNAQKSNNGTNHGDVDISGYLNLVADFAHNFTDGLAIGASYLTGKSIGILTTITILLHEIPHEIGDIAILVKSGCSKRKAMWLQLLTAVGAIAGTALAVHGAGEEGCSSWVLPFTAGGFIYIATVSVLPELLEDSTKLTQSVKEISALLCGVGLMTVIANFE